ncbi:MAG: metal-dependent hydrolase [Candidatus Lokiarchaeota archaeon]|nr:metal-dependent hydrolase [Candidatus Lokiarchaeota archaeon]
MLAPTHAFVGAAVAVAVFWTMPAESRPNHGRFLAFALAAGMLVDFDFLSGFLELAVSGSIPPTLQEFVSQGRHNHPVFTHSMITLVIAAVAAGVGFCLLRRQGAPGGRPATSPRTGHFRSAVPTITTFAATVTPQLLLRLGSCHWWGIDDPQLWSFNITMATIFLAGIGVGIAANVKRPAYMLVFGLGVCLHLLCDMIQYWVLVLGPFDPAWAAGEVPLRVGLDLYSDSDILLGVAVEGPAYAFMLMYLVWYAVAGRKRIKG